MAVERGKEESQSLDQRCGEMHVVDGVERLEETESSEHSGLERLQALVVCASFRGCCQNHSLVAERLVRR